MAETTQFAGSSHLSEAAWEPQGQTLTITFQDGSTYTYSSVPQSVYMGLQRAVSPGQFFHRQIKDRYSYTAE